MLYKLFYDKNFCLFILGLVFVALVSGIAPPNPYPTGEIVHIAQGSGLYNVGQELKEKNVIRSPFWFRIAAIAMGGERRLKAGDYYLEHPQSVVSIAWRILKGEHNIESIKVTIPEGFTVN